MRRTPRAATPIAISRAQYFRERIVNEGYERRQWRAVGRAKSGTLEKSAAA
jgi:hypothetical protein